MDFPIAPWWVIPRPRVALEAGPGLGETSSVATVVLSISAHLQQHHMAERVGVAVVLVGRSEEQRCIFIKSSL